MNTPPNEVSPDLAQSSSLLDLQEEIEEECGTLIECQESNTLSALENSSTVSSGAAHQLDLIDQFDLSDEKIMFKEFNEADEEPKADKEIHSAVERPDLASLEESLEQIAVFTESKHETDSLSIVTNEVETIAGMKEGDLLLDLSAEVKQQHIEATSSMGQTLPDVVAIAESSKSYQSDQLIEDIDSGAQEESTEPGPAIASFDESISAETKVQPTATEDPKDTQIRLLWETLQSIGNLLSESIGESAFIVPEELSESSAKEVVSKIASMVAKISEKAAQEAPTTQLVQSTSVNNTTKGRSMAEKEINKETAPQKAEEIITEEEEWEEIMEENNPAPDYGLESPVISHLLTTWTTDTSKIEFLRSWVRSLYMPSYENLNYPPGLQITNLSNVLKDGFMVLLVPLIRSLAKPKIVVHVKRHLATQLSPSSALHHPSHGQLNAHAHTDHNAGRPSCQDSHDPSTAASTDPFANDILYDIRIKRLDVTLSADAGQSESTEEGYMIDHTAAKQFFRKNSQYRVDTEYYSPLSEINSALPAIEEQTKRRIFDHAPDAHHHSSSSSSSTGPRFKSFDAGPRSKNFERDYMSTETGASWERSASFSVAPGATAGSAYVVPAAAPSILQSIYTWWGAAPLPTPALLSEGEGNSRNSTHEATSTAVAFTTSSAAASSPTVNSSANSEAVGATTSAANTAGQLSAHSSTASIASTETAVDTATSTKSATSVPASPARAPVNKIAERLQKIRVQKQPQA